VPFPRLRTVRRRPPDTRGPGLSVASGSLRSMGMPRSGVRTEPTAEQRLLLSLAAWSTWSAGVGIPLWRVGRREGERTLGDAGRMTVAWALGNAAVAGWGAWRLGRSVGAAPATRARRLALLTGGNALLDVAYVAVGVGLAMHPRRRGDGVAVAVQGVFLTYLDTRYCLEFAAQARAGGDRVVLSAETEQAVAAPRIGACTRPASSTSPGGRAGSEGE
jgi:hypothetical protein